MNVFITGSSTTLGAAVIETCFSLRATIFTCNRIPEVAEQTSSFFTEIIEDNHIDLVLLFHPVLPDHHESDKERDKLISFSQNCCNFFSQRQRKPKVICTASSISVYDTSVSATLTERSSKGDGKQARYFRKIEKTTRPASQEGIRVLSLRTGQVLSNRIAPPIKKLPFSPLIPYSRHKKNSVKNWVSLEDAARAVFYLLAESSISGPVNIVSGDAPPEAIYLSEIAKHFHLGTSIALPHQIFTLLMGKKHIAWHTPECKAFPMILMEKGFIFEDISLGEYFQKR